MDIEEHDPIRTAGGNAMNSGVRDGIELWGEPLKMTLPDLSALGFKAYKSDRGLAYDIHYRLVLECNGANISIKWQIALPGTEPYDGKWSDDGNTSPYVSLALTISSR